MKEMLHPRQSPHYGSQTPLDRKEPSVNINDYTDAFRTAAGFVGVSFRLNG